MAKATSGSNTPPAGSASPPRDEATEVLQDVREEIERLPRFADDHTGMFQDPRGAYLLRNDVLGVFALYLGGADDHG